VRRLRDVRGCRRELARIYGLARDGSMDWSDAARAGSILMTLTRVIEGSDFERRIAVLEQQAYPPRARANGRNGPEVRI
jgi:hypothetical protein